MGNYYASFGGRQLETQVMLCAGCRPYLMHAKTLDFYKYCLL
jgi:hypothetical protein